MYKIQKIHTYICGVHPVSVCTENTFGMQLKKLPFYIRRRNLFVFVPSPLPEKEGTKLLVAVAEAFYFFKIFLSSCSYF